MKPGSSVLINAALMVISTVSGGVAAAELLCVYDYPRISNDECNAYRDSVVRAGSRSEVLGLRARLEQVIAARRTGGDEDSAIWYLRQRAATGKPQKK